MNIQKKGNSTKAINKKSKEDKEDESKTKYQLLKEKVINDKENVKDKDLYDPIVEIISEENDPLYKNLIEFINIPTIRNVIDLKVINILIDFILNQTSSSEFINKNIMEFLNLSVFRNNVNSKIMYILMDVVINQKYQNEFIIKNENNMIMIYIVINREIKTISDENIKKCFIFYKNIKQILQTNIMDRLIFIIMTERINLLSKDDAEILLTYYENIEPNFRKDLVEDMKELIKLN